MCRNTVPENPCMNEVQRPSRRRRSPLATGIVLIVFGGFLLAMNLGWNVPRVLWELWPLFLIGPGIVGLISPSRHLTRSGALWLVATGVYCLIATLDWMGLGWFSAWPVFVIAYGLDIIFGDGMCGRHSRADGRSDDQVSHER